MIHEPTNLSYRLHQESGKIHKIYIYDEIRKQGPFNWQTYRYEESETSAKYFRDLLARIPAGETIELHVNSQGGEVGQGVAIYNLLREKAQEGNKIVAYVDGMAYSVAVDIVMSADEIHMGLGTSMFFHNTWCSTSGNAEQLRSVADQMDALTDAAVQLYMSRAKNLSEDELREMMNKETMLDPQKCLEYGFCDFVGEKVELEEGAGQGNNANPQLKHEEEIAMLKAQLYQETQINQMLRGLKPAPTPEPKQKIKNTFFAAMQH